MYGSYDYRTCAVCIEVIYFLKNKHINIVWEWYNSIYLFQTFEDI